MRHVTLFITACRFGTHARSHFSIGPKDILLHHLRSDITRRMSNFVVFYNYKIPAFTPPHPFCQHRECFPRSNARPPRKYSRDPIVGASTRQFGAPPGDTTLYKQLLQSQPRANVTGDDATAQHTVQNKRNVNVTPHKHGHVAQLRHLASARGCPGLNLGTNSKFFLS